MSLVRHVSVKLLSPPQHVVLSACCVTRLAVAEVFSSVTTIAPNSLYDSHNPFITNCRNNVNRTRHPEIGTRELVLEIRNRSCYCARGDFVVGEIPDTSLPTQTVLVVGQLCIAGFWL